MTRRLVTGRIVWAAIADANGIRKLRPAVIVTPTDRLTPTGPIDVVAITSRLTEPLMPRSSLGARRICANRISPCRLYLLES